MTESTQFSQWEAQSVSEWFAKDPLRDANVPFDDYSENIVEETFSAYRRSPIALRARFWSERIYAASLYAAAQSWELPGFSAVAIGISDRMLTGLILVDQQVANDGPTLHIEYDIPTALSIDAQLPPGFDNTLPLRISGTLPVVLAGVRVVFPGRERIASPRARANTPVLQSSTVLEYLPTPHNLQSGTMSLLVRRGNQHPLGLVPAHAFGPIGSSVFHNGRRVGQIVGSDPSLDAALVQLDVPWHIDYRVPQINLVPAAPLLPTTNLAVQMVNARGQLLTGHINAVNLMPISKGKVPLLPDIRASFYPSPIQGDSGALLLSGHGTMTALDPSLQPYSYSSAPLQYTATMLGTLIAVTKPGISSILRQEAFFRPIVNILGNFQLEPHVRQI